MLLVYIASKGTVTRDVCMALGVADDTEHSVPPDRHSLKPLPGSDVQTFRFGTSCPALWLGFWALWVPGHVSWITRVLDV